jgi:zona occludens toxin
MLFITTGANGAGKTLLTIKDVRELQLKTGRPVAYNGRFKMVADFGWKLIEAKDWQDEPDGTIFLLDECQYDFPLRGAGRPPEWIERLSEHRARGFDFFLLTQHVQNIDVFVRRLVGPPGWHRHVKAIGPSLLTVSTYQFANPNCEKPGASSGGEVSTRSHPKEVYAWYESATLHTARAKLPRAFVILVLAAVAVPVCAYFGYRHFMGSQSKAATGSALAPAVAGVVAGAAGPARPSGRPGGAPAPMTLEAYLVAHVPRIPGLPQTAPAFDELTKPSIAPFPAACVESARSCKCWTQQGTALPSTPRELCHQIVEQGFFMEWAAAGAGGSSLASLAGVPAVAKPVTLVQAGPSEALGGSLAAGGARAPARGASGAGGLPGAVAGADGGPRVLIGPAAASQPPQYFGPAAGATPYLGDVAEDLPDGETIGHIRRGHRSW